MRANTKKASLSPSMSFFHAVHGAVFKETGSHAKSGLRALRGKNQLIGDYFTTTGEIITTIRSSG